MAEKNYDLAYLQQLENHLNSITEKKSHTNCLPYTINNNKKQLQSDIKSKKIKIKKLDKQIQTINNYLNKHKEDIDQDHDAQQKLAKNNKMYTELIQLFESLESTQEELTKLLCQNSQYLDNDVFEKNETIIQKISTLKNDEKNLKTKSCDERAHLLSFMDKRDIIQSQLRENVINNIRLITCNGSNLSIFSGTLSLGQKITIANGPLCGLKGEIHKVSNRKVVCVRVNLLNMVIFADIPSISLILT